MLQKTIKKHISTSGIGLHSGETVSLTLSPAPIDTGIVFRIVYKGKTHQVILNPTLVEATQLATTLGIGGATIATVEHLLSAIAGMQIDNIYIDVVGNEVPIADGSAEPFVSLLEHAGIVEQNKERIAYAIIKECEIHDGKKYIRVTPYNGLFVDYTIDFNHPLIGVQRFALEITPESFKHIANARTFGFIKEIEYLRNNNLTLGGSLENAIVLDEQGILNKEGLRYRDEFVKHKIVDFIGDIAMFGAPLQGHFTISCSGHALNNQFLRHIYTARNEYLKKVTSQKAKKVKTRPLTRSTFGYRLNAHLS